MDDTLFKNTYISFIDTLLFLHPCTRIIICFGNSATDDWPSWTTQLTRLRNIAKEISTQFQEGNVTYLEFPYTADYCGYGDGWHPSLCSHEAMSTKLVEKIDSMNINWGGSGCITPTNDIVSTKKTLQIYPNPATNSLTIIGIAPASVWRIYDQLGQLKITGQDSQINISELSNGLYFIKEQNTALSAIFVKK